MLNAIALAGTFGLQAWLRRKTRAERMGRYSKEFLTQGENWSKWSKRSKKRIRHIEVLHAWFDTKRRLGISIDRKSGTTVKSPLTGQYLWFGRRKWRYTIPTVYIRFVSPWIRRHISDIRSPFICARQMSSVEAFTGVASCTTAWWMRPNAYVDVLHSSLGFKCISYYVWGCGSPDSARMQCSVRCNYHHANLDVLVAGHEFLYWCFEFDTLNSNFIYKSFV